MRLRGYVMALIMFGFLSLGAGECKDKKKDAKDPCAKEPAEVNGIPVNCSTFATPAFAASQENDYYQAEVREELDDALAANHLSFEVVQSLKDPHQNNTVVAAKAARELKKKADHLCKRLKC
jgi:hypothetical protein